MARYPHTQSLGHLTGLAGQLFNQLLTRRFSEAGIDMTAEQWGVLLLLLNHAAMTQRQIGEQLYLDKSTISRSISGLEKRGWVQCCKGAGDARQKHVSLTPAAQETAERCAAIARSVLADAQAGLDDQQLAASQRLQGDVIANLRNLTS